jgi:hypothetical protein
MMTKTRARVICRLAAERIDSGEHEFVCNAFESLRYVGLISKAERDTLTDLLRSIYGCDDLEGHIHQVIWSLGQFGPADRYYPNRERDPRIRLATEARVVALLLLPEFV